MELFMPNLATPTFYTEPADAGVARCDADLRRDAISLPSVHAHARSGGGHRNVSVVRYSCGPMTAPPLKSVAKFFSGKMRQRHALPSLSL
jgi:hypothetical protein